MDSKVLNIGQNLNQKLRAFGINTFAYDPQYETKGRHQDTEFKKWPDNLDMADFVIFTCALNQKNRHMFDHQTLKQVKKGVKIINVGRGPLILEKALIAGLDTKVISSAALDVFESEPIEISNKLLEFENA